MSADLEDLKRRAQALGLHGLCAQWPAADWVEWLVTVEEEERRRRSLERRLRDAHLGAFKPIADFDWGWPREIDREAIEDLFGPTTTTLAFSATNPSPNGVGKSMISKNLAYQALRNGHTVLFNTASEMLSSLATRDGSQALQRRLGTTLGRGYSSLTR